MICFIFSVIFYTHSILAFISTFVVQKKLLIFKQRERERERET